MLVHQILKSKAELGIISVKPDEHVSEVTKILSEKRIGTVVVSTDGLTADGILSERDIVRELGKRGTACLDDKVKDLMTRKLVTCAPGDSVAGVLEQMTEGRFRHVPVIEDDHVIGLISIGDVVKAQLSELSMEKEALEGMIMGH